MVLRIAIRPRFLGLLALFLCAAVICGFLAKWQIDRASRDREVQQVQEQAEQPLQDVISIGEPFPELAQGHQVSVEGHFVPEQQVLVPDRKVDGKDAVLVITAFEVQTDEGAALIPILRGWMSPEEAGRAEGVGARVSAPAPEGNMTLHGWLQHSEGADESGAEPGQIRRIASPVLVNMWQKPVFPAYVALEEAAPGVSGGQALSPVTKPEIAATNSVNLQNIGYAVQWVIFGGFAIFIWLRLVRDTYRDEYYLKLKELGLVGGEPAPGDGAEPGPDQKPSDGKIEDSAPERSNHESKASG